MCICGRACRQAEGESECDMRWKAFEPTWLGLGCVVRVRVGIKSRGKG